ncbi:MAG: hypothetical protein IPH62_18750 [Ignavibacteriae bacterium]|nr:hypothetical protein [Ignavibacteriota bacterium]
MKSEIDNLIFIIFTMEKEKKIKKTISKNSLSKSELKKYILKKIDKLSWEMGEKKYNYRENLHDR